MLLLKAYFLLFSFIFAFESILMISFLLFYQVNGEVEKKDDSGNETGAGDHEQEDDDSGYDKTKSFFDNISCEASIERAKGKNRTDWRQERKLNSETFGFSSTRRGG